MGRTLNGQYSEGPGSPAMWTPKLAGLGIALPFGGELLFRFGCMFTFPRGQCPCCFPSCGGGLNAAGKGAPPWTLSGLLLRARALGGSHEAQVGMHTDAKGTFVPSLLPLTARDIQKEGFSAEYWRLVWQRLPFDVTLSGIVGGSKRGSLCDDIPLFGGCSV